MGKVFVVDFTKNDDAIFLILIKRGNSKKYINKCVYCFDKEICKIYGKNRGKNLSQEDVNDMFEALVKHDWTHIECEDPKLNDKFAIAMRNYYNIPI